MNRGNVTIGPARFALAEAEPFGGDGWAGIGSEESVGWNVRFALAEAELFGGDGYSGVGAEESVGRSAIKKSRPDSGQDFFCNGVR